jgi:hypothetical protein
MPDLAGGPSGLPPRHRRVEMVDGAEDVLGGPDELGGDQAGHEDELGGPDAAAHEDELG